MSNWLVGLTEDIKAEPKPRPTPAKNKKKVRQVVEAIRAGKTSTQEITEATGLTEKDVWNSVNQLRKAGALEREPVRYRLTNSYL